MKISKDLNGFITVKKKLNLIKKIEKSDTSDETKDNLHKGNKIDKKA